MSRHCRSGYITRGSFQSLAHKQKKAVNRLVLCDSVGGFLSCCSLVLFNCSHMGDRAWFLAVGHLTQRGQICAHRCASMWALWVILPRVDRERVFLPGNCRVPSYSLPCF